MARPRRLLGVWSCVDKKVLRSESRKILNRQEMKWEVGETKQFRVGASRSSLWLLFFFFQDFTYVFERERVRDRAPVEGEGQREKQASR